MKCLIYHSCFQGRIGEPGMTGEKGVPGIAGPRVRFLVFFDQVGCLKVFSELSFWRYYIVVFYDYPLIQRHYPNSLNAEDLKWNLPVDDLDQG